MFTKHIVPAVLSAILVTTAAGAVFAADAHKAVKGTKGAKAEIAKQCKMQHANDKVAFDACVKAGKVAK